MSTPRFPPSLTPESTHLGRIRRCLIATRMQSAGVPETFQLTELIWTTCRASAVVTACEQQLRTVSGATMAIVPIAPMACPRACSPKASIPSSLVSKKSTSRSLST